jgi:hypothetical protein
MGVSPFDKPEMETVAVLIPSLTWPLIWLTLTGYSVLSSALGIITDPGNAAFVLAFSLGLYYLALCFWRKRVEQREQWRQNRFDEWLHKPLAPPPVTDWERFEYDVAKMVTDQENPQRIGKIGGKQQRDKGGRSKHPAESHHIRWAKGGMMQDDWR